MSMTRRDGLFLAGGAAASGILGAAGVAWVGSRGGVVRTLTADPSILADNPELLDAASAVLKTRALAAEASTRKELLSSKWMPTLHVAYTPTLGNRRAEKVLIEFTDYTCAPCKVSASVVEVFAAKNRGLRVAVIHLPVVGGAVAEYMGRFSLVAYRQNPDRFPTLHKALMELRGPVSEELLLNLAIDNGLNGADLFGAMDSPEISNYMQEVRNFAVDMNVSGVPAFAMDGELILGGVTERQLNEMASKASA